MKRIIVICDLGVGGERGRVLLGVGIATAVTATEYKDPMKVLKRYANHSDWCNRQERTRKEDYLYTGKDGEQYGIFKLSPRECGRLMGVLDSDIDKMLAVNSNSQCYKQFGNSIVVPVLCAIFSQLHIQDVTPWNERSESEIEECLKVVGE